MRLTQLLCARGQQFQYWKRYVEKEMQKGYMRRQWHPITGWKIRTRKRWYYGEHRPWTTEFRHENNFSINKKKPVLVQPLKEWQIFKGDLVEVLVGKDKGKQGIVSSIIKERNWVYVEGLNVEYTLEERVKSASPTCVPEEKPLLVTSQVALVEPGDLKPTEVDWRYTDEGEKIRVSQRTGRIIPLPNAAYQFDDMVIPALYIDNNKKDTDSKLLEEVTFQPKLCTFEEEIMDEMGIVETRKPARTFWY